MVYSNWFKNILDLAPHIKVSFKEYLCWLYLSMWNLMFLYYIKKLFHNLLCQMDLAPPPYLSFSKSIIQDLVRNFVIVYYWKNLQNGRSPWNTIEFNLIYCFITWLLVARRPVEILLAFSFLIIHLFLYEHPKEN